MAALGISDFKGKFQGGARNNLFKVVMGKPPEGIFETDALEFLVTFDIEQGDSGE